MQWLVKKVLETREETGDYIRNLSLAQFSKTRKTPQDEEFASHVVVRLLSPLLCPESPPSRADTKQQKGASEFLTNVKDRYKPARQFRSHQEHTRVRFSRTLATDTAALVDNTLLEYGQRWMGSGAVESTKKGKDKEKDEKAAAEAAEERRRIESLIGRKTCFFKIFVLTCFLAQSK